MSPADETTTKYTLTVKQTSGSQEETLYYNEAGETVAASTFSGSINGGAFEGVGIETLENSLTTEMATQMNVGPIVVAVPSVWEPPNVRACETRRRSIAWEVTRGRWTPKVGVVASVSSNWGLNRANEH